MNGREHSEGDLEARIAAAVEEYVKVAPPPGDTASVDPELLGRLISRLDELYWKKVAAVVSGRLADADYGAAQIPFGDDDRLLLDFGLLNARLPAGSDTDSLRSRLMAERSQQRPDDLDIKYFSDWLESRFRYLLTIEEVGAEGTVERLLEASPELRALVQRRNRLLDALRPYMRQLPGVAEALSRFIADGRLDDLMLRLFLERLRQPGEAVDKRLVRLEAAYRYAMHRLAERLLDENFLNLIDEYSGLRLELFRKVNRLPRGALEPPAASADKERTGRQLATELRLVRSLLHLGTVSGGISRPHSVLLRDLERATPASVAAVVSLIREADPRLPLERTILIAPFTGNGFFEWDRDTLVVSLIPARSVEEDVTMAASSLRMSLDRFQHDEELKRQYQKAFAGRDFREAFTRDYLAWVLRVSRGQKQHISQQAFEFFVQYIGHNGTDPVPLPELAGLTLAERNRKYQDIVAGLRGGKAGPNDLLVAGVICWHRGDHNAARRYLEQAAGLAPADGRILYSLGALLRNMRMRGTARRYLLQCTRNATPSIWKVYAFEALRRLPA